MFVTRIWVNQEGNCYMKLHIVSDILNVLNKMAFLNARWAAASVRYLLFRTSGCRTQKKLCVNKAKVTKVNHNLSKEEIFASVPELEVDSEYSEEEEVLKETPGSPISKTS
jgi:hypothetical protein